MADDEYVPSEAEELAAHRRAIEMSTADLARKEATFDQQVVRELATLMNVPEIDAIVTFLSSSPKLADPTRQKNVENMRLGLTSMRDVSNHMLTAVNSALETAPAA